LGHGLELGRLGLAEGEEEEEKWATCVAGRAEPREREREREWRARSPVLLGQAEEKGSFFFFSFFLKFHYMMTLVKFVTK
jgi:hypothetical protein